MKALAATAAVALCSALATTGAQADEPAAGHAGENETISVKGGYLKFRHHGEIVELSDKALDGRGLRVYIREADTKPISDYKVTSDYTADGDPVQMNLSIREGQRVEMMLCYTVDHKTHQCSDEQSAIA